LEPTAEIPTERYPILEAPSKKLGETSLDIRFGAPRTKR